MKAHASAGTIPDPHQHPTAALVVLRAHTEIFENTHRFLNLTSEKNAESKFMSGANVHVLLNLLPARVRDVENLNAVEKDDEK